jgi:hypothetical protein
MAVRSEPLLDGEKADLVEEAEDVLGEWAPSWLDTENAHFGGMTPREFIQSGDPAKQQLVRNKLRAVKCGSFS